MARRVTRGRAAGARIQPSALPPVAVCRLSSEAVVASHRPVLPSKQLAWHHETAARWLVRSRAHPEEVPTFDLALARARHVWGVVLWIGDVAFVTLALLPGLRDLRAQPNGTAPQAIFDALKQRLARQARWTIQLTGLTGLYLLWRLDLWRALPSRPTGGCTRW